MLAVLSQSIQLLIFPAQRFIQLLDQVISLLQLIGKPQVLITAIRSSSLLLLLSGSRISLLRLNIQLKQLFARFASQVTHRPTSLTALIKHRIFLILILHNPFTCPIVPTERLLVIAVPNTSLFLITIAFLKLRSLL